MYSQMYTILKTIMEQLFAQGMLEKCSDMVDWSRKFLFSAYNGSSGTSFETIYNYLAPYAVGVAILLFAIQLWSQVAEGKSSPNLIIKICVQAVLACVAIVNGPIIMKLVLAASNAVTDLVRSAVVTVNAEQAPDYEYVLSCIACYVGSASFVTQAGLFILIVLPFCMSYLGNVIIMAALFIQTMELLIQMVLAPLAFADCYGPNIFRLNATRYLKKIAATAIQGAVIIGLCFAFSIIMPAVVTADPDIRAMKASIEAGSVTDEQKNNAREVLNQAILAETLDDGEIADVDESGNASAGSSDNSSGSASKSVDQAMAPEEIAGMLKRDGKKYYEAIFTSANTVAFCAMQMGLILMIANSKSLAMLIVG